MFVIPFSFYFQRFIDLNSILVHSGKLDPIVGTSVSIKQHSKTLGDDFTGLFFGAILIPIVCNDRLGEIS